MARFNGVLVEQGQGGGTFGGIPVETEGPKSRSVIEIVKSGIGSIADDWNSGQAQQRTRDREAAYERGNEATQQMIERQQRVGTSGELDAMAAADQSRVQFQNAPAQVVMRGVDFARDQAVSGAQGAIGFGESAVGLGDLATGWTGITPGGALEKIGYDPQEAKAALGELKSDAGKARDAIYESTRGFTGTMLALQANPGLIADKISESLVGTVGAGAIGASVVRAALPKVAAAAEAAGLTGAAAEKFISDRIASIAIGASAGAEGAQGAGNLAETARQGGREWSQYVLPAIASGVGTATIAAASGGVARKLGIGDIESDIAMRGAGKSLRTDPAFIGNRMAVEGFKEGVLEEMPQSVQEAAWENVAMGRPWDEGLGKAAATGLATGFGMGAGHATIGGRQETEQGGETPAPAPAARADEVLGAPTAKAPTEADKALYTPKSLTALDRVNEIDAKLPEATPEEVAALQTERASITASWPKAVAGAATSFSTETGARLDGQYALMEADDLTTSHDEALRPSPTYPTELQPRQRERHASEMQIQQIVQRLDPARLGEAADAANGAPIVGADGLVESGNARTIALKRVHRANGLKADTYRQFIKDNAARFGLTPDQVDGMQKPVLVRVRSTPVNRAEFARQANASTVARMSPSEQAKSDAAQIDSLEDLRPDDNGDFMSGSSNGFVRRFMAKLAGTEQSGMVDATGQLSQAGYSRIRNAVLAKAYGDSPVLLRMVESLDDNTRNLTKALMRAAPQVAKTREAIGAGALFDADITPDLMAAVEELSRIKEAGGSVRDALAQGGMFGDKMTPETRDLLAFLDENMRRPRKIAEFIQAYLEALEAAGNPNQGSLLGDATAPAKADLMAAAKRGKDGDTTENAGRGQSGKNSSDGAEGARQPADAPGNRGGTQGDEGQTNAVSEWVLFPQDSGTIGIPRAEMPQIKGDHRGALIQFLASKGITYETVELPASELKPTQAEYSTEKVKKWGEKREGVDRSVLASSDGYILDGHHQWMYALGAGETEQVIRFSVPIRELLAATFQFPSVQRSEGANVVELRAKNQKDIKDALADLAEIATKHTRAAMLPENTPNLMPTLIKLSSAAIKEVGYQAKDIIARVKQLIKSNAEFGKVWNKIDAALYRKAALKAAEQESLQRVDDLFAMAEQSRGQQDLFGAQAAKPAPTVAMIDGRPYDMKRDNYRAKDAAAFIPGDLLTEARGLIDKYFKDKPKATISDDARAKAEASIKPLLEKAEKDKVGFDQAIIDVAKSNGISQMVAPLKSIGRAAEKVVLDYVGDASQINDLLRATVIVSNYNDAAGVITELAKRFKVSKIKNKAGADLSGLSEELRAIVKNQDRAAFGGYADVSLIVITESGLPAEVQINVPAMMAVKDAEGHKLYEAARAQPKDSQEEREIDSAMQRVYDVAFSFKEDTRRASLTQFKKLDSELDEPFDTGAPGSGTSSIFSSSSLNQEPSGNSTNSSPLNDDMNRQPSGNLSGTFIASTPSDNSIAKGEPTSYTSIKEPGKGDANEQQRKDGAAGTQGQGAGSPQGTDGEREAQGVREGARGGNRGTDDNAGASDGGQAGVRENRGSDGVRPDNERSAADGQGGRAGRAVGVPAGRDVPAKSGQNYRFGDDDLTYEGGWLKKAAQNVEAVELAKKLQTEERQATREEQAVLAKFIGWGASEIRNSIFGDKLDKEADAIRNYEAAKKAVDEAGGRMTRSDRGYMEGYSLLYSPGYGGFRYGDTITSDMIAKAKPPMGAKKWVDLRDRLKAALTPDEWTTAERSTQYAHYTSKPVVQSMWKAVERMGFKGGAILEPGAGIGVFPGLMAPAMATNSVYTGIEYDALTGEILKQLFPDERILVESFVDSALPDNFYDMAIGNPPFADVKVLADPAYKKHAFSLHDYFFAKSIDKVKPGGLMIYVTSRYTMDKKTDKARAYLGDRADLIGAIRLPQTAFQKNAGTEVVTDVMFLRKKVPGEAQFPEAKAWLGVAEVQTDKGPALINEYFANHPEMVLGKHSLAGSMYSKNEYTVLPNEGDIEAQFAAAVENLPADIYQATGDSALAAKVREIDFNPKAQKEGNYYLSDAGILMQREGGVGVRSDDKPAATVEIVKSFIKLRDALKQAHYDQLNNGAWEDSLAALQKEYRAFVKKHGNILQNKAFERATKRVDEETGEEVADTVTWRRFDLLNKINDDPDYTLVEALEVLNEETGEITESKFLTERVLAKQEPPRVVTPHDSLLSVLNDVGRVDMPLIAERLGITQDQAIEALGTAVYESPSSGWQMADEYLSGNVKKKLQEAKEAAKADRRLNRNVEALTSAQPSPVPPADITPALGMSWIPANVYEQFLQEKTGVKASVDFSPHTKKWTVTAQSGWQSARATVDWGAMDRNAADILDHALTGRPIRITRTQGKGDTKTTVFDAAATEAANQKLKQMRDAFAEWIWQDGARTDTLTRTYNDTFNTIVSRSFDGRHLTMPGASTTIKVFDHVKRGAWRIIQAGNSYLAHAVGSGKTWQMVISAMEQKRLGLINKPMMVVPNHMLQQFAREWQQLYPAARLMVADEKNFHTNNRRRFVSRVALSDLDGVIITHSAFKLLDLDPAFKRKMIEQELTLLRAALAEVEDEGKRSPKVRDIQNRIEKMEQKLEAAMSSEGKDKNVRFDQLGVDMLYVDEAHEFRKLAFTTQRQVKGIDSSGSDRAFDLFMKTRWLEEKKPGRSLVMASGTPVTNTLAELYSVQRFMAPQVLEDRGIPDFDSWAAMFGQENTEIEADAAGKYSPVTRFTKFVNVPELTQMFREFADVLTSDHLAKMLGDKRPKVKDGSRKLEITPQTADYTTYKAELAARLEASRAWKPSPDEPNNPDPIIKIIGDGRLAAIDMRFIWPDLPSDPSSKLNKMLDGVIEVYKRTADIQYRAKSTEKDAEGNDIPGEIEPDLGGAQMVFSDLGFGAGVAQNRGFNARAWAEKRLRDAGIPAKHIAFMSDHKKSTAKLKLFQDVNAGRVRILFGSSKNMGTGVNAQQRLVALHHLDTPWYPADLEQREGRIIRQGNKNPNVEIYAYSTKGSYDTVMWQMLTSKQRFIDQALSGDSSVRSIDDLTEASQFQIATAMTAGDPRAIQLAGIKADIEKLQRLFRAHEETRAKLRRDYEMAGLFIESAKSQLPDAEKLAARVKDLSGENFTAKADGQSFGKRKEWGEAMLAMLKDFTARGKDGRIKAGELSGFPVEFVGEIKRDKSEKPIEYRTALVIMEGEDMHILARDPNDDPVGMSMRATNLVAGYARRPAELRQRIKDNTATRAALESRLDAKFQFANELSDKLKEAAALEQAMLKGDAKSLAFDRDEWANATTMFSRRTRAVDVDSDAFRRWFGDSKVVDAAGNPLRVYHGTRFDFSEFDGYEVTGWFSTDPKLSGDRYAFGESDDAGPNIMPVYLHIENPKIINEDMDDSGDGGAPVHELINDSRYIEKLVQQGYDGIVANENGVKTFAAFSPTQIKSAISNTGEFSGPDIMQSRGTGRGMVLRDLQAVADRVAQGMKNLPRVNVMESPASLSTKDPAQKALRDHIRKAGAWDDVEGATHEGEIYLFASGLADETRAEHVLATHEVTHYGLRGAIGKDLDGALLHVLMTNAKVRKAAATKKASLGLASNLDAVEEVLADMPDTDLAKLSGWRRVVKVVRDWLNRSGMKSMAKRLDKWIQAGVSDQEKADLYVADLVSAARDWVKRGKGKATVPGTMLAEQKLSDDWAAQERWLSAEAKARGFKSIDELAEKDYPAFEKLAAKWREKNPVSVALLSRGIAKINRKILDWAEKLSNTRLRIDPVMLLSAKPGDALRMAGLHRPIVIDMEHARHAMNTHPEITPNDFAALPDLLDRPRAILKHANGWRVIVDSRDGKGNPLAVALTQENLGRGDKRLKVTGVSTLFGKDESASYIATELKNGNVIYMPGKEIAHLTDLLSRPQLPLPEGKNPTADTPPGKSNGRTVKILSDEALVNFKSDEAGGWGSRITEIALPENAPEILRGAKFSRSIQPAIRNSQTANKPTADDIIAKPAATARPVDAVMRGITQAVRLDKLTTAIYNRAGFFLDRLTPETIKAGLVSDYGIPEAVTDMRAVIQGRQRQQTRAAGALLEKLATLTRAESRVAYEWMNTDNPQSSDWFMEQLPPESVKVLAEVEKMIDDLSKEAVALGQLDADAYKRNRFAYLRRSYTKHEAELTKGEAAMRKRAIAILGDQYKGRGMTDSTPMKRVQNTAPEWWGRKTVAGKADKGLKGEKFIRLEKRAPVGAGTAAVPGTGGKQVKPRLLEIAYWPASEPIPARYGSWDHAGTWEVRDTKGADLVLWRDFTKQEREAMGEIDEVRYAIAKTLHGMIHDVETGRYLQWLAQNHAKKPGETISGTVIEASDRMRDTFKPGEWVQVPETVIPGTRVKKYGTLAGRFLPGPIWNDVRQVVGFRYQPLGETYAMIHRAWKTSKTALSPAVHMNNVMANFVMADWHDVTAGHVLKALKLMLSKEQAAAEVLARFSDSGGSIGTWAAKELQREQLQPIIEALEKELGLAGNVAGQVGVMSALQLMLKGSFPQAWDALKPSKPGKAAVAAGRALINLYEAEDQVFRLAAWLRAKEQGATDLEAGKAARKSFLDYSINAPWVQMMRSTLLPFVAFTYRSVPMALETAAKKPWKIMKLAMIAGAVNALGYMLSGGDEDDERKLLPEEKAGKIWGIVPKLVRMPWNDDNGSPVFLDIRRYVPVGDVFDVGQSHAAIPLLPSMTPGGPLMVMAELALDRTQFTGKQITKDTDSWDEQAAKVLDHLYKAFAPNIILLPGTYAFTGAVNAGSGKTDSFGREQSLTQAVVSSVGVKLGSYPKDVLRLNETRAAQAKLMEIDSNITQLGREYQRKGITREKFNQKVAVQAAKKKEVLDELGKKMAK